MPRFAHYLAFGALTAAAVAAEPEIVNIKTLQAQMRYNVTDITTLPGVPVKILFENADDMPHNLVICKPGTDVVAMANKQLEKPEEAVKRNFLPEDPAIVLHTKLVGPHEKDELTFTSQEAGDFPFVCTMPGHAMNMKGVLHVVAPGKGLSHLTFKLYLGEWDKLPDFSKLQVHREGEVPDNLVQLKFDDYKNNYGVVFEGTLNAPKTGDYGFSLASDDGSRILIDGKKIVEDDGIHPAAAIRNGKAHLEAGDHKFRLEYFQKAGESEIFAGWQGDSFSKTALSKWVPQNWVGGPPKKKNEDHTGMPLIVDKEPVLYRNFISGAGTRGIGVGYPGGFNIAWSAQSMNLQLFWRGAFIDAARHWTDRGGGYQPPLGYDVVRPAGDIAPPFAVLGAADAKWPTVERNERAEGYEWKGYRLDAKRYPTFLYTWGGVKVSDRIDTEGGLVDGKLVRTLTLDGPIPQGAVFRVANGTIQPAGNGFAVDAGHLNLDGHEFENKFVVEADGAKLQGDNLVVPAKAQIKVIYTWPMTHLHAHGQ